MVWVGDSGGRENRPFYRSGRTGVYSRNETAFLKPPPRRLLNENLSTAVTVRGWQVGGEVLEVVERDGCGGLGQWKTFRRQNDATCANTTTTTIYYTYMSDFLVFANNITCEVIIYNVRYV